MFNICISYAKIKENGRETGQAIEPDIEEMKNLAIGYGL